MVTLRVLPSRRVLQGRFPRQHHHTAGLARSRQALSPWGSALSCRAHDLEHYRSELQREKSEIKEVPETERAEVRQILRKQGLDPALAEKVTEALTRDRNAGSIS